MTTYEKLGQYASSELPIAPSNVVITSIGATGDYNIAIDMTQLSITITAV